MHSSMKVSALMTLLLVLVAYAGRMKQEVDVEQELATQGFGLQSNQYITAFYNRMMTADRNKVAKYTYVTPLFCAKAGKWFDVTAEMVGQKNANTCVKVTCHPNGQVDGELLNGNGDCGEAGQYVPGMPRFRKSEAGLRLLPTGDPFISTEDGEVKHGKHVMFKSKDLSADGKGNYDVSGADVLRRFNFRLPKTKSWAGENCNRVAEQVLQELGNANLRISDEASYNTCVRSCEAMWSRRIGGGANAYLAGDTSGGRVSTCEKYDKQNAWHHMRSWFSRSTTVSKDDCTRALQAQYTPKKNACSVQSNYCATAKRCSLEKLLPTIA